ncbi:ABC transporter ATP-binding protein [Bordetella sp. 15P40C-2]|uniref:ABC transporter ATP-binding protein n=1 Tax=Bordetella sp. 15P40C-2 TaxID=2572246 RepID=UPI0013283A93|nr:ABC transporter ATP-binding protein [Bordetella sp. 15P40C-2]MVW70510.1 ATP-binding cassette domain-containing protein [Bordetella sp. 15P40C-2]
MMTKGARVRFQSVCKNYGDVQALRDFSLDIGAGEFLTILGSSGSGKSTVLNALAGFSPASSGEIYVNDQPITYAPPEKRNIGMVFQNYSLFPHMNVLENVSFPLTMRKMDKLQREKLARKALDIVRLGDFAARKPKELSGGQQQRVAIARAIVFSPSLLLMDEPLGALDLKLREALQFEIKEIQHELNCTVIYVTHDQREALAMSNRIAVLRAGQIEQVGTPADIYDKPCNRFVADFIGNTNLLAIEPTVGGGIRIPELGVELPGATTTPAASFVSIRPERFSRVPQPTGVAVQVVLQEMIFLGDVVECSAATVSGRIIHFKESRLAGADRLERGQTLYLSINPDDLVFVKDA